MSGEVLLGTQGWSAVQIWDPSKQGQEIPNLILKFAGYEAFGKDLGNKL